MQACTPHPANWQYVMLASESPGCMTCISQTKQQGQVQLRQVISQDHSQKQSKFGAKQTMEGVKQWKKASPCALQTQECYILQYRTQAMELPAKATKQARTQRKRRNNPAANLNAMKKRLRHQRKMYTCVEELNCTRTRMQETAEYTPIHNKHVATPHSRIQSSNPHSS